MARSPYDYKNIDFTKGGDETYKQLLGAYSPDANGQYGVVNADIATAKPFLDRLGGDYSKRFQTDWAKANLFRAKQGFEKFTGDGLTRNESAHNILRGQGMDDIAINQAEVEAARRYSGGQQYAGDWMVGDILKGANNAQLDAEVKNAGNPQLGTGGPSFMDTIQKQITDSLPWLYNDLAVKQAEARANQQYDNANTLGAKLMADQDAAKIAMRESYNKMLNPYGNDNRGLQMMKEGVLGQTADAYGRQALGTQADLAQRNMRQNSGLAASLNDRNRLNWAKQSSMQMGNLDAQNYDKQVEWDKWMSGVKGQMEEAIGRGDMNMANQLQSLFQQNYNMAAQLPGIGQGYATNALNGMTSAMGAYSNNQTLGTGVAAQNATNRNTAVNATANTQGTIFNNTGQARIDNQANQTYDRQAYRPAQTVNMLAPAAGTALNTTLKFGIPGSVK